MQRFHIFPTLLLLAVLFGCYTGLRESEEEPDDDDDDSAALVEADCDDQLDNDDDGAVDCNDPDCEGDPACEDPTPPEGACTPASTLACGDQVAGNNGGDGSTEEHVTWGCTTTELLTGPETIYMLEGVEGEVTVELYGHAADLDLFVLVEQGDGCDPEACVASSESTGAQDEALSFTASAGGTWYVVVDGFMGNTEDFVLTVTCETAR